MSTEQQLLNKWRKLPIDKQQEVLQFYRISSSAKAISKK